MHLIPEKYSAKHQPSRPIALLDLLLLLHTCAQILVQSILQFYGRYLQCLQRYVQRLIPPEDVSR